MHGANKTIGKRRESSANGLWDWLRGRARLAILLLVGLIAAVMLVVVVAQMVALLRPTRGPLMKQGNPFKERAKNMERLKERFEKGGPPPAGPHQPP
jgi:uncharacterized membrane protein